MASIPFDVSSILFDLEQQKSNLFDNIGIKFNATLLCRLTN